MHLKYGDSNRRTNAALSASAAEAGEQATLGQVGVLAYGPSFAARDLAIEVFRAM
jgi:hypothetical protein